MEPEVCGCGEIYLNLGCFCDADGLTEKRPALLALSQAHRAVFPAVYAHLRSARDLEAGARQYAENRDPEGLYRLTRGFFELPPASTGAGARRDVFLQAWTPEGLTDHTDSARALCPVCIGLRDPCGLSAPLLARLERHFRKAGCDCVRVLSPLDPARPAGLLVPSQGLAFLATAEDDGRCAVTVDTGRFFRVPDQAGELLAQAGAHCREAASLLAKAKSIHDEMEAVCRPFISFEGVDLLTQEYKKQLRKELLIN